MAYEQDERGVPINPKSHEDMMREIERVRNERAQKVHEERVEKRAEPKYQDIPEHQEEAKTWKDIPVHQEESQLDKAKHFGRQIFGLEDRKPLTEKAEKLARKEYEKFVSDAEKEAKKEQKLKEAYEAGQLKRAYRGEISSREQFRKEQAFASKERRLNQTHELRMAKAQGRGAVAGGFNLRTQRQEYRPQQQDVFGMDGIFENVSAPQTNIGQRRTQAQRPQAQYRPQSADSVLGLTNYSRVGNAPSVKVSSQKSYNKPQGRVMARENAVSVLGLGGFVGAGHSPVQREKVGAKVGTKIQKESRIKTRIILQKEDPLAFLRI